MEGGCGWRVEGGLMVGAGGGWWAGDGGGATGVARGGGGEGRGGVETAGLGRAYPHWRVPLALGGAPSRALQASGDCLVGGRRLGGLVGGALLDRLDLELGLVLELDQLEASLDHRVQRRRTAADAAGRPVVGAGNLHQRLVRLVLAALPRVEPLAKQVVLDLGAVESCRQVALASQADGRRRGRAREGEGGGRRLRPRRPPASRRRPPFSTCPAPSP